MSSEPPKQTFAEDLPLLNNTRPDSAASSLGSNGVFTKSSSQLRDPESPDNEVGDLVWYILFAILSATVLIIGLVAIFTGNISAVHIGVDDQGFVCGYNGKALMNYAQSASSISANLKWSRALLFSVKNGTSTNITRTCVDNCPASTKWICTNGLINKLSINSSQQAVCSMQAINRLDSSTLKQSTFYGYCVSQSLEEISRFLQWMVAQLSFKQFALVVNFWYLFAIVATVITIAVIANIALAILFYCTNSTWNLWTVFLIFVYVAAAMTLGAILILDVNQPAIRPGAVKERNATLMSLVNKTEIVPSLLISVDRATIWTILAITMFLLAPIVATIWAVVWRSKDSCQHIVRLILQVCVSRTTLARLQIFTFINSLVLVLFQFVMLLFTFYVSSMFDEAFSIGIFTPNGTLAEGHVLSTILMTIWTLLWLFIAEAIVSSHYLSVSSHIWHHFFERNYYFSKQTYHEKLFDARSFLSVSQFGVAFHGAICCFCRFSRMIYFSLVTLFYCDSSKWPISKLSEAIYCVSAYYNGTDFNRSRKIFEQITDERAMSGDNGSDAISMFSILTTGSSLSDIVRYSASSAKGDDNQIKWKTAGKKLENLQAAIDELKKKIAKLSKLEEKQKGEKMKVKIVRDMTAAKEKSLSEKEAQVRRVLTKLLAEFEQTKRELGEALDRQRVFEIKKMTSPPDAVKLTIEAVAFFLGEKDLDWNSLKVIIVKDSFLPTILRLDADTVSIDACKAVRERYFKQRKNKGFTLDRVSHASTTCGILYRWLDSLTEFALERDRIKPLLSEIDNLVKEVERLRAEDNELRKQVALQNAFIFGARLQAQILRKKLEKMRDEEDSLSIDMTTLEKLAKEERQFNDTAEAMVTIEKQEQLQKTLELVDKQIIQHRLLYFIWIISCFSYVIVISLCVLAFPIARAYLTFSAGNSSIIDLPYFYAAPFALVFCLVFTINSGVIATFESLIHTCAVACLLYVQNDNNDSNNNNDKLYSSLPVNDVNSCYKLPKTLDSLANAILRLGDESNNNIK